MIFLLEGYCKEKNLLKLFLKIFLFAGYCKEINLKKIKPFFYLQVTAR